MTALSPTTVDLAIETLTYEAFAPFGTVIDPKPDGTLFGPDDAQLVLGNGTPRFYTMTIPGRGLMFDQITRHRQVTQVLSSAGGMEWFIAVAAPSEADNVDLSSIRAFRIPSDTAIMLAVGTWHAGPLFNQAQQNFFNLELADTNEVDHETDRFGERTGRSIQLTIELRSTSIS